MGTKAAVDIVAAARYPNGFVDNSYWRMFVAFCFACCLALMAYHPNFADTRIAGG